MQKVAAAMQSSVAGVRDEDGGPEARKLLPVIVSHVVSPGEIYIQDASPSAQRTLTRYHLPSVLIPAFITWAACSSARAGSGFVRMDPLHFLAGCRTRRLNQA